MAFLIFIVLVILVIIIKFLTDRDKMQREQVGNHGGMLVKYKTLIVWFKLNEYVVSKIGKDYMHIECNTPVTSSLFQVMETFGGVDVIWNANLGVVGKFNKKWHFKNGTNQEFMIDVINEYLGNINNSL